jgi:hypothetical protein
MCWAPERHVDCRAVHFQILFGRTDSFCTKSHEIAKIWLILLTSQMLEVMTFGPNLVRSMFLISMDLGKLE